VKHLRLSAGALDAVLTPRQSRLFSKPKAYHGRGRVFRAPQAPSREWVHAT